MKNLPDKIYATPNFDRRWQTNAIDDESVEFVRKDTFIKKVANYLNYKLYDRVEITKSGTTMPSLCTKGEFIEDFKKYMED